MREEYLKVSGINLARFNKAEFIAFLSRVMSILPGNSDDTDVDEGSGGPQVQSITDGVDSLYIDQDLIDELQGCIDSLTDLNRETRSSVSTQTLAQLDKERDALLSYIFATLSQSLNLPLDEQRESGTILYNALKVYTGAGRLPQTQETYVIKGMLLDMEKDELSPHVEKMGLKPYAEKLKAINEQYEEQSIIRNRETAPLSETAEDIRARATKLYQELADRAFAANLLHKSDESLEFIEHLNIEIDVAEKAYKRRMAQSKGESTGDDSTEPDDGGTTTPDEDDDRPVVQ